MIVESGFTGFFDLYRIKRRESECFCLGVSSLLQRGGQRSAVSDQQRHGQKSGIYKEAVSGQQRHGQKSGIGVPSYTRFIL